MRLFPTQEVKELYHNWTQVHSTKNLPRIMGAAGGFNIWLIMMIALTSSLTIIRNESQSLYAFMSAIITMLMGVIVATGFLAYTVFLVDEARKELSVEGEEDG